MNSICEILENSVRLFPDQAYLLEKTGNSFNPFTYKVVKERVYSFAAGLLKLGIKRGDRIAIMAEGIFRLGD